MSRSRLLLILANFPGHHRAAFVPGRLTLARAVCLGGALAAGVAPCDALAPPLWHRWWQGRGRARE